MSKLYNPTRGDLITSNNNIYIIDYDNNNELILKKYNDHILDFLDLLINNSKYFLNRLRENNIYVYQHIEIKYDDFDIYNDVFLIIKNAKCLIKYKKEIKTIQNIINILYLNLHDKNKLDTSYLDDYLIIYV
jgi:hypothetical protein